MKKSKVTSIHANMQKTQNHAHIIKSKYRKSFVIGLVLFCILPSSEAEPQEYQIASSNSSEFSHVEFGPTHYAIPKTYAAGITPFNPKKGQDGKGYAAFTLNVLLPDLEPSGSNHDDMHGKGWGRHLTALFEYGLHIREVEDRFLGTIKDGKLDISNFTIEANGCHLYKGNMIVTQELYTCNLPDRTLMYECRTYSEGPFPYCNVHEQLDPYTTVIYSYAREYKNSAIDIDNKVRSLERSFRGYHPKIEKVGK